MSNGLFSIIPGRFDYPSLDINREINDIFNFFDVGTSRVMSTNLTMPRANVSRTQDGFCVEMASPGFSRSDFNIDIDNGTLNISVESNGENVGSDKKFTSREFSYSSFSRSWRLPESVNTEAISASYESGILTVNIPTIDTKPKKLTINID